ANQQAAHLLLDIETLVAELNDRFLLLTTACSDSNGSGNAADPTEEADRSAMTWVRRTLEDVVATSTGLALRPDERPDGARGTSAD
ncbi:hypothetical protein, partial [Arthrobacter sp. Br18]|uniref:hypothetical protein n=1 Tax=Arthrobacter sp. Br18 TaxID=1312954 RepID=UPI000479C03B